MMLAGRMREAAKKLKEFSTRELCDAIEVRSYKERGSVWDSMRDFLRRKEFERISRGRYRYLGRKEKITLRQRLWDIARRMIRFNLDDLEQITGAQRETIKEFTSWMVQGGYAQRIRYGHFKIVRKLKPVVPRIDHSAGRKI